MARLGRNPDRERRRHIAELRAKGLTWREIGDRLGITRQCAHELVRKTGVEVKAPGPRCRECLKEIAPRRFPARYDTRILCMACLLAQPETTLADRLKTFRITAGMTQLEAATKAKIVPSRFGEYEQGRALPQWPALLKLVRLFGIQLLDVHNELSRTPRNRKNAKERS